MDSNDPIADLFALDTQTRPAASAVGQPVYSSEECTSDTCTDTCSGCRL
jgi:hypothetical protein